MYDIPGPLSECLPPANLPSHPMSNLLRSRSTEKHGAEATRENGGGGKGEMGSQTLYETTSRTAPHSGAEPISDETAADETADLPWAQEVPARYEGTRNRLRPRLT